MTDDLSSSVPVTGELFAVSFSSSPTSKSPGIFASQARGKKRPASPGHSGGPVPGGVGVGSSAKKKKKLVIPGGLNVPSAPLPIPAQPQVLAPESSAENKTLVVDTSVTLPEASVKPVPFKDPNFVHSGIGGAAAGKKNRTWKNLKQILAAEKALPWQLNDPNYYNIDAPPSFKPTKKYSDISGLMANYTDPQTKLRFSSSEEFSYIRMLPVDVVTGYLALRKATCIVP
ncbi:INO80 complex subunit C [Erpetoichthys calabaricus]|uniref:INO80 complex subunit C n=1 Tax=Erpetoichthys calabaricus TaxID=27687 RepID=A0A8C4SRA3_ERPCA|nr:INO80 complex subunit C [Erpetoichthys calabaricus]